MLQSLPEDSPQRVDYVSRADQLRQRMGITDDPIATEKSDEALRRLENIFAQEAFDKSLLIPDAELATYDLTKLTTLGVPKLTKQWDALITRWVKVKKEINNAEQSVVTNPDQAHS